MRLFAFCTTLSMLAMAALTPPSALASAVTPPQAYVDTTLPATTGRVVPVRAGADLQAALDAAQPGDVLTLEAGATFTGNFRLPRKTGSEWITVRTSAPDAGFPTAGARVGPSHAGAMAKIVTPNSNPAIAAAPGAHHYRLIGLEVTAATSAKTVYSLVAFGGDHSSPAEVPTHLILDRCYVHGLAGLDVFRGVLLNGAQSAVVDSHISEIHVRGFDSQAVLGYNGPGPFRLFNNYLEGAGENVMFGGADPKIANLVPSDIEIRRNRLVKPLSWKIGDPAYAGTPWTVKNLLELKNARRVLIDGNVLENNWVHAQSGSAVLFTPRNQDGSAPWSVVEDVTFTNNVVRNVVSGIHVLGQDDSRPSRPTQRIHIGNNLFLRVERTLLLLIGGPVPHIVVESNTAFPGHAVILAEGQPFTNLVFRNNLVGYGAYGIIGTGTGPGSPTIARYFPQALIRGNVFVGDEARQAVPRYPQPNAFVGTDAVVMGDGVTDAPRPREGHGATASAKDGGAAPGVDVGTLDRALGTERRAPAPRRR